MTTPDPLQADAARLMRQIRQRVNPERGGVDELAWDAAGWVERLATQVADLRVGIAMRDDLTACARRDAVLRAADQLTQSQPQLMNADVIADWLRGWAKAGVGDD